MSAAYQAGRKAGHLRVWHNYPGRRIIYQDSIGDWSELLHEGGRFTGFAPARDMVPT